MSKLHIEQFCRQLHGFGKRHIFLKITLNVVITASKLKFHAREIWLSEKGPRKAFRRSRR